MLSSGLMFSDKSKYINLTGICVLQCERKINEQHVGCSTMLWTCVSVPDTGSLEFIEKIVNNILKKKFNQ